MFPMLALAALRALAPTVGVYVVKLAVDELKRRGFQTTYVEAIGRALGAGLNAAAQAKLDPFSEAGMKLVGAVGAKYLLDNVGSAAASLGIDNIQAGETRILAELGKLRGHMIAVGATPTVAHSEPVPATVAGDLGSAVTGTGFQRPAKPDLAYTGDESQLAQNLHG